MAQQRSNIGMISNYVIYGVMMVAAGGMLWANQQFNHKGVAWGRPLAGFFGVVALSMAFTAIYLQFKGDDVMRGQMREKESQYQFIAMKAFGAHLATMHPGSKALLVMPPTNQYNKTRQEAILAGLNAGFGNHIAILEKVELGAGEEMIATEAFMSAKEFDDLYRAYRACDLMISLIGLPMDYQNMRIWKMKDNERPKLAVVHPPLTEQAVQAFIHQGLISVALSANPAVMYNPNDPVPKDEKEAFDKRFLLIHAQNLEAMMNEHQRLFGL